VAGYVRVQVTTVSAGTGWLDLSDNGVVEAAADLPGLLLYLGDGVTMRASLTKGRRYCGIAVREEPEEDGWVGAYRIYAIGLPDTGGTVRIKTDDTGYVYDSGGLYLGVTGGELPYRSAYYIKESPPEGDGIVAIPTGGTEGTGNSGGSGAAESAGTGTFKPQSFYGVEAGATPATSPFGGMYDNPVTGRK